MDLKLGNKKQNSGKIYVKTKYESFSNETLNFFFESSM